MEMKTIRDFAPTPRLDWPALAARLAAAHTGRQPADRGSLATRGSFAPRYAALRVSTGLRENLAPSVGTQARAGRIVNLTGKADGKPDRAIEGVPTGVIETGDRGLI